MNDIPSFLRTIRFRITLLYAALLLITFLLIGLFVVHTTRQAYEETVDMDLHARFNAARGLLTEEHGEDSWTEALEEQQSSGAAGVWIQVSDAEGHMLFTSEALKGLSLPPCVTLPPQGEIHNIKIKRQLMRVLSAPFHGHLIQIAIPVGEFAEMLQHLKWTLSSTLPLILLIAGFGGYWLSGRALKPVDDIGRTVQRISSKNLSERLTMRGSGDELDRLAETLNGMLDRLEASFHLVTRFTADVSHELRTPMAIIRMTGEVIAASKRTPEEHERAWMRVSQQAERISRLIDDLLLLARVDAGYTQFDTELVDLGLLVESTTFEISILAETSGIALTASIADTYPVVGDPDALRRVFLVLLENALKYTPHGGSVNLRIRKERAGTSDVVVVSVQDSGIGIGPNDLPRIFDRFYRVATDRSRQTGGVGLGLSIAQSLVAQHQGRIVVTSLPGQGSIFEVELPLRPQRS